MSITECRLTKQQAPVTIDQGGFDNSLFGSIGRGLTTVHQYTKGFFSKKAEINSPTPELHKAIDYYQTPGKQLDGKPTYIYLTELISNKSLDKDVTIITELFISRNHYNYSKEVIIKTLNQKIIESNTKFISIPLALPGHITHLLIELEKDKDGNTTGGVIEFFDSFGKPIEHPDNRIGMTSFATIAKDVCFILSEKHNCALENFSLVDHKMQIQQDFHSCGVFVGEHFRLRLVENKSPAEVMDSLKANPIEGIRIIAASMLNLHASKILEKMEYIPINPDGDDFDFRNVPIPSQSTNHGPIPKKEPYSINYDDEDFLII
jgi:hypothetical protein